jgi:L-galactose dehydrogenase
VIGETLPALAALRQAGKARFLGITGYPLEALTYVAEAFPVDTVLSYCRYTLLDHALGAAAPTFAARGAAVMNATPLAMGLLSAQGAPAWHPAPSPVRQAAAAAARLCAERGLDIAHDVSKSAQRIGGLASKRDGAARGVQAGNQPD